MEHFGTAVFSRAVSFREYSTKARRYLMEYRKAEKRIWNKFIIL